jgi:hypothetical protein
MPSLQTLHYFPDRVLQSQNRSRLKLATIGTVVSTLAILLALPTRAFAITLVTSRAALAESDRVDWASLGPIPAPASPFAPAVKVLPYNFAATSNSGLGLNVSIPTPAFIPPGPPISAPLLFQTTASNVPTNFSPNDFILFTGLKFGAPPPTPGNPGPITITFNLPVTGAGTQIAADDALTGFTVFLSAYDSSNTLLGTVSTGGTSSLLLDNTAQFLGVRSDTANISKIVYSSSIANRGIGINALSIAQTVPEPFTIFGTIIGGTAAWKMKKKLTSTTKV